LTRQGRETLADACRDGGLSLAGLAVTAQAVRAALALPDFPRFALPGDQLWGALLPAALSLGFFQLARVRPAVSGLLAYTVILLGLIASHYAPATSLPHRQPNLGLFLALAALLLWRLGRPRTGLAAGQGESILNYQQQQQQHFGQKCRSKPENSKAASQIRRYYSMPFAVLCYEKRTNVRTKLRCSRPGGEILMA
jgi:hypothetical protein